jgi:hypothetical protein
MSSKVTDLLFSTISFSVSKGDGSTFDEEIELRLKSRRISYLSFMSVVEKVKGLEDNT